MEYFLCVLGMVLIVEGLPYFAVPSSLKEYFAKMQNMPERHLRVVGFITMMIGLGLVYLGRQ